MVKNRYLKYALVTISVFFGFILFTVFLFFLSYYAFISTQKNAVRLYQQSLVTKGREESLKETVVYLKGLPIVKDAYISETSGSIWIDYVFGLKAFISTAPAGGL